MGDDRAPVRWDEHDPSKLVIRASAIGHPCLWELIAAGQNIDNSGAPKWMKRAFLEGHLAEPGIVKQLVEEYGVVFESHQDEGELVLLDARAEGYEDVGLVVMMYHPDGVGMVDLRRVLPEKFSESLVTRCVVEIKNFSHDLCMEAVENGVETTIADYPWQLSGMMIEQGLPGLWAFRDKGYPPDKETGIKPYCAGEGKLYFQYVPEPLVTLEQMRERAQEILEGVLGEDLLTSDRPCDDILHFPCLYRHVRPEPSEEEKEMAKNKDKVVWEVPEEMEEEYEKKLRDFLYFKGQMDEAEQALKRIGPEILAVIPEGTNMVRTSTRTFGVRNSHSSGIKWDEVPDELKDQLEQYRKSEVTGRHVRDFKRLD